MTETSRYAYAVTRSLPEAAVADVSGLRESRLRLVGHRGLQAVVSDVPAQEFGEEGLKLHLEDLAWLEEVARAHDDVVRAVAGLAPVAPMRLGTLFHDDDGVRRRLADHHDALAEVLDRVEGRGEWSVKVIAQATEPEEPVETENLSGADFLRLRKARATRREQRQEDGARVAEAVHYALAECSVAARSLPPQDPQLSGETQPMLLNGAYLVGREEEAAFTERLRVLISEHPGVRIEHAGPWPPYSFAVLEQP